NDALFRVEVRDAFRRLMAQGWTDALRTLHPGERIYTFWDYFRNAYARDAGLRIDHLLLSPALAPRLTSAGVDRDVRGWEKASDHAPVWIELVGRAAAEPPKRAGRPNAQGQGRPRVRGGQSDPSSADRHANARGPATRSQGSSHPG